MCGDERREQFWSIYHRGGADKAPLDRAARGPYERPSGAVGVVNGGQDKACLRQERFAAFVATHPDVKVSFRELAFPCGSPLSWLADVDVALCYSPTPHPHICIHELRSEPRVVLVSTGHPLARRAELTVTEVLDETFCGTSPSLEPVRAGFWRLDDHRGAPAPHVTDDEATNPHEVLACIASGRAIITAPASNAANVLKGLTDVIAVPLRDAKPARLTLTWRKDNHNPNVIKLTRLAGSLQNGGDRASTLASA